MIGTFPRSPIRPPASAPEPPVAGSSRRHSHRSKATTSVKDLAAIIRIEQHEHRETQRELSRVTELLRLQTLRADEAQQNLILVTERLKIVNEQKLAAVREAARANESLGLYKFQLETAQNEILRAQSVFDIVERERYQAELAGAKSRTAARRLNEKHKVHLAREEGRRLGMKEGFQAGRLGVFADSGDTPAPSNFGGTQTYDYYADGGDFANELLDSPDESVATDDLYSRPQSPNPPSIAPLHPPVHAPTHPRPLSNAPPTQSRETPAPLPVPPPASATAVPAPAAPIGPLSPLFAPFHDIHPIPVHNQALHPRHEHVDIPPDGYIPSKGPDGVIHVPPAHDFIPQREASPPRSNGSIVEESAIAPSTFARAMSPRQQNRAQAAPSTRAESVRRAPSTTGSIRPVQMPTPRMNTNLPGIERQAQQRSSWSSDFFGGGATAHPNPSDSSSGPIPINVQPPSRGSYASSAQPNSNSTVLGPAATGTSPMPGADAAASEGLGDDPDAGQHAGHVNHSS
ncbi:hypothetical protein MVEN_00558800 [Mycena venus]|uniref:Uncharacterized protein n=1 Tax=Mycena venus TaxID=2733690 RepID=A0A8H7D7X4_9AGAR|nr:hypothetical protein MVEN_00558800 [Mycena venus]